MTQPLYTVRQLAYVVTDMDAALTYWTETLKVGPFFLFEHCPLKDQVYRGKPGNVDVDIALGNSGALQIELIRQRNDAGSVYKEFLDAGRVGVHHFGLMPEDYKATCTQYKALGHEAAFEWHGRRRRSRVFRHGRYHRPLYRAVGQPRRVQGFVHADRKRGRGLGRVRPGAARAAVSPPAPPREVGSNAAAIACRGARRTAREQEDPMHWQIGDTKITKIQEIVYDEFPDVIPAATPEVVGKVGWISPFVTPGNVLTLSIHTLIVDSPGATVVVDTCIGNGRDRDPFDVMSRLATTYLDDMQAAGYDPDGVDYVLCTHLHLDHVGWNTHEVNGKWVPTFPNAKYLMDQNELDLFGKIDDKMIDGLPEDAKDFFRIQRRVFEDSMQPVIDAGLTQPVKAVSEGSAPVCDGVRLIRRPATPRATARSSWSPRARAR